MIPTFVFGWPTGQESGDFLALDLGSFTIRSCQSILTNIQFTGGTNLRVCLVTLQGEGKFEMTQTKYRLTEEQKQDEGTKLFDFCAECLKTFIDTNFTDEDGNSLLKPGELLPLGFTVRVRYLCLYGLQLIRHSPYSFPIPVIKPESTMAN